MSAVILTFLLVTGAGGAPVRNCSALDSLPFFPAVRPQLTQVAHAEPSAGDPATAFARYVNSQSRADYVRALRAVEAWLHRSRDDARASFVLGWLYATGPDLVPPTDPGYLYRSVLVATNAETRARKYLGVAVRKDSAYAEPAIALARLALATRTRGALEDARRALEIVVARKPDAVLDIMLSDVRLALRDSTAAVASAREALGSTDCAAAWHALALGLAAMHRDSAAGDAYAQALDAPPDDFGRLRLLDDVRVLLTPEERERLRALPPDSLRSWLTAYWNDSAARSGLTFGERIAEHMRRLTYASTAYRRNANRGTRPGGTLWVDDAGRSELPWDMRGILYIRHGKPDRVVTTVSDPLRSRLPPNRTWIYRRGLRAWVFNFAKLEAYPDWSLISGVGCGTGSQEFYTDRAIAEPRYYVAARACGRDAAEAAFELLEIRAGQQQDLDLAMRTEDVERKLENPLRVATAAYAFRDSTRQTVIVPFVWTDATDLTLAGDPESVRLRVSIIGTGNAVAVIRHDAVVTAKPPGAAIDEHGKRSILASSATLGPVRPGSVTLRFVVLDHRDPATGADLTRVKAVPSFDGREPSMSDLVIASMDPAGLLVRNGVRIAPVPENRVHTGDRIRLYYEVYDFAPGATFRTSIRVERRATHGLEDLLRLFRGKRDSQQLAFDEVFPDDATVLPEDRSLEGNLVPGTYDLSVEVREQDRVVVRRTTTFRVGG